MSETILSQAHETIMERETLYGSMRETMETIGRITAELSSPTDTPGQRVALGMVVMKLVRRVSSPENPDHLLDAAGYLGIFGEVTNALEEPEKSAQIPGAPVPMQAPVWPLCGRMLLNGDLCNERDGHYAGCRRVTT